MPVFIDQCSLVCAHLAFVGGLKGCKLRIRIHQVKNKLRIRIHHLKYIPLVSCDSI